MDKFIGREDDIRQLREENWRPRAKLAVVYGRRRVGKTALVQWAFRDRTLWKFEGLEGESATMQIALFRRELSRYTQSDAAAAAQSWDDVLRFLDQALARYTQQTNQPLVVFFDEFQWMCGMKPHLVSLFKYHWDNFLSRHRNVTFVLCGSVSSFIVRKVIQSRALYGRIDLELNLRPLSLREARLLLPAGIPIGQCLETYMVFGGIPQYLIELNPKFSLAQNLNEYALKPSGYFFQEFGRLFISHFASHPLYERILHAVTSGPLTPAEIAAKCGANAGGGLTRKLDDLVLAGFLAKCTPIDKANATRLIQYRIADEYLHFYFSFIAPKSADIVAGNVTFSQLTPGPQYRQWQGYAFERLCRKHARDIAAHLRFSGINFRAGEWFKRGTIQAPGAQVDLLFLRADKVLTLCEIKYADQLALRPLCTSLEQKMAALREAFPAHAIETVLILGKDVRNREQAATHVDHLLLAEDIFF